jgi:CBS domain-containing protein
VARRGYHLSREYAVDPLEILFVREVARTNFVTLAAETPIADLEQRMRNGDRPRGQYLFPVTDAQGALVGVMTRNDLEHGTTATSPRDNDPVVRLKDVMITQPVIAYSDEPLRVVVHRMATTGLTRFPVVERDAPQVAMGIVSLNDLLKARARNLDAEQRRERILPLPRPFPPARPRPQATTTAAATDGTGAVVDATPAQSPTKAATESQAESPSEASSDAV